jgi:cytochrome oxidase Cu insertion factor (SCO1/SenC/PrrC family)
LKVDNICIDEHHTVSISLDPESPTTALVKTETQQTETHALTPTEKSDIDALFESYRIFMNAKSAYEAAAELFWKSPTGTKLETILAPDPQFYDRAELREKIKILESRLASISLQIKNNKTDISGYNHIVATYTLLMYETQSPPRTYNEFALQTCNERIIDEIPKLWTNKMIIQRKKIVDCVYIYGHVLPPYRLNDIYDLSKQ